MNTAGIEFRYKGEKISGRRGMEKIGSMENGKIPRKCDLNLFWDAKIQRK